MSRTTGQGHALSRVVAWVVAVVVIAFLALFATFGYLDRNRPAGEPYPLLLKDLNEDPLRVLGAFVLAVVGYVVVLGAFSWWVGRTLEKAEDSHRAPTRLGRGVDWILGRWWRVSLLLALAWAPIFVMQAPGTSNADLLLQTVEVLGHRQDLSYPPFDVYPIPYYLIPPGDLMLSNHHNVFLTLIYGHTLGWSRDLFGTFKPGFVLLTSTQALFTLAAFGRATSILSTWVDSLRMKVLALVVLVVCGLPVAMWSVAIAKNPLFAAAFVWWLALCVRHVRGTAPTGWRGMLEWGAMTLVMVASTRFGLYIALVQVVVLLIARRGWPSWRGVLLALAVPAILFDIALRIGAAQQWYIPADPLAGKGFQIQTLALAVRENPDVLSPQDRADLNKIFDVDTMIQDFDRQSIASIIGAGYKEGAYHWRTVTKAEVAKFDHIYLDVARKEPGLIIDGAVLKTFSYFDPFTRGNDNWPSRYTDDGIQAVKVDGSTLSDDGTNDALRTQLTDTVRSIDDRPWIRMLIDSPARVVAVILVCLAGLLLRRPYAWVWVMPLALHAGVLMIAPLSSSGRYALGLTYALPLTLLAIAGRRERAAEPLDEPAEDPAEDSGPAPEPEPVPAP